MGLTDKKQISVLAFLLFSSTLFAAIKGERGIPEFGQTIKNHEIVPSSQASLQHSGQIRVRILKGVSKLTISGMSIVCSDKTLCKRKKNIYIGAKSQVANGLFIQGVGLNVNGIFSGEKIKIIKNNNQYMVIQYLPLNEYLEGVIPNEVPENWPLETLKAQIVAAKSYVLSRVNKDREFDVENTIFDQVFRFGQNKKIKKLIVETKDVFLMNPKDGKVLKAYYHAECGGKTASAEKVFGDRAQASVEVDDPYCLSELKNKWTYSITKNELSKKVDFFQRKSGSLQMNKDAADENFERSHLLVLTQNEEQQNRYFENFKMISANDFRKKIGFNIIKSTWFKIYDLGEKILFRGIGSGHGVGLCQRGSKVMAEKGFTYDEILRFYYPQAMLVKEKL